MPRLVAFQTLICCIWYHQLFIHFNLVWDVELVGCGWMEMSETAHGMFRLALCFAVTLMIRLEICKLLIAWTNSAHKDEVILVVLLEFPSLIITRLDKFVCSIHLFLASVCWCFQAKIHELYLVVCSLMSVEKSEVQALSSVEFDPLCHWSVTSCLWLVSLPVLFQCFRLSSGTITKSQRARSWLTSMRH